MNKNPNSNLLYLDGLRALASIYVLLHHAILQYYGLNADQLNGIKRISVKFFFHGHLAVNLFIILSGFCLMLPVIKYKFYLNGGTLLFYKKRIARILPPYYLAILMCLILIWLFIGQKTGTHWDYSLPVTYEGIITHILLINDFLRQYTFQINHSLWSIPVECRIYVLFPVLVYLWRRIGPLYTLFVSIFISFSIYLWMSYLKGLYQNIDLAISGVNPYIILFTLGMLAAYYSFYPVSKGIWQEKFSLVVLLIISIFVFIVIERINQTPLSNTSDLAFGACCFFFLILTSKYSNSEQLRYQWISKVLSWQPLVFIGSFSYSLYLIHAPFLQLLSQYVINPLHFSRYASAFILVLLSLIIIVPLSYLFFIVCEKPFMVMGKRMNIKQTEIAAVVNPAP